jgi:hypothetical protein
MLRMNCASISRRLTQITDEIRNFEGVETPEWVRWIDDLHK